MQDLRRDSPRWPPFATDWCTCTWDTDYRPVHRIIRDDLDDIESFVQSVEKLL